MATGKIRRRIKRGLAKQADVPGHDERVPIDLPEDTDGSGTDLAVTDNDGGGADGNTDTAISPAELTGDNADATTGTGKKRGRKPGQKNRSKETPQDLAALLFSIHMMGAVMLQSPEVVLSKEQSEELGAAIARVNEVYGGIVVPERVMCLINLGIVSAKIYVPKVVAISRRKRQGPKVVAMPTPTPQPATVPETTPENVN